MQRPGADPDNMEMSDFLCDFCGEAWTDTRPMVEGHQGHAICGECLTRAFRTLVLKAGDGPAPNGQTCIMCLEMRAEPLWAPADRPQSLICTRCTRQSAAVLSKDKEMGWERPKA
jgi:hypothetical protein